MVVNEMYLAIIITIIEPYFQCLLKNTVNYSNFRMYQSSTKRENFGSTGAIYIL